MVQDANFEQLNILEVYESLWGDLAEKPNEVFKLLKENFNIKKFIHSGFYSRYYKTLGSKRDIPLEAVLSLFVFKYLFSIPTEKLLRLFLLLCKELRKFCGFDHAIPDEPFLSRFKETFETDIKIVFDSMVSLSLDICDEMGAVLEENGEANLAEMLVNDTSALKPKVKENNPKFLQSEIRKQENFAKTINNEGFDPVRAAWKNMPKQSLANPAFKLDYINGHFCYGYKFNLINNGFGLPLDYQFLDEDFYNNLPIPSFDSPEDQKYFYDNASLRPSLDSFISKHGKRFTSFLGDSEFDSYANFEYLKKNGFNKIFIPINSRGSSPNNNDNVSIDEDGIPFCTRSKLYFKKNGVESNSKQSKRFKFICPLRKRINGKVATCCEHKCTDAVGGRSAHVYPNKDFRLYPGVLRNSDEFIKTYKIRSVIERTISSIKSNPSISSPYSRKTATLRVDFCFALMSKHVILILAHALKNKNFFKNFRSFKNILKAV